MKKLVVLAMLFVAVAAWAQLTAGVTLDYMWAQDFGPGKEFSDRPILELKFTYKADDFTSVYIELEEGPLASQGKTNADTAQGGYRNVYSVGADRGYNVQIAGLDRAYFTTDLGKALKLPVPVVVMYGLNEWNGKETVAGRVTKSEFEDWLGEVDIRNWGAQIEVMPSPAVTLRSAWAWNPGAVDATMLSQPQILVGAYGTVAPISYEIYYDSHSMGFDKGWIEGAVKFAQDMTKDVNVAAMVGFGYDMAEEGDYRDASAAYAAAPLTTVVTPVYGIQGFEAALNGPDAAPAEQLHIQAGAQVMFQKMVAAGVSYRGATDFWGGAWQVQGYFTPKAGDPLEVFAQLGLGVDSDVFENVFDSLEVALRYTMGKVQWYLGFFYNNEFGRGIAKEWADFDLAGVNHDTTAGGNFLYDSTGETTAIFMRGKVAL